MTAFEFAVTYAVCWWLVLFMVLPHKAEAPVNPEVGHAPSAPENPRLGKKFRWTTLLAFIPAIALYFIVDAAHGAETIYHAGSSNCDPISTYKSSGDVDAKDGFGTGGKKVAPATLNGQNFLGDKDQFDIPLAIPSENYIAPGSHNVDLSESFIGVGKLSVSKDGTTTLNGKSITQDALPPECAPKNDSSTTTKN